MQHKRYGYGLAALAAAAVVLSGCSTSATDTQASQSSAPAASSTSPSAASTDAAHNDADVMFAQGMIPHHQQAIEMSDMLLAKQGIDPEVISLANDIKKAQGPEIEQMQGWLKDWGASSTPAPSSTGMPGQDMPGGGDMSQMPGMEGGHMSGGNMNGMPGMAGGGHGMMSQADMTALQNAQGAEAGRLFLTQMIEHHKGAIMMAQHEIDNGQFPAAIEMARNIVSSQQKEINTMQGMLDKK